MRYLVRLRDSNAKCIKAEVKKGSSAMHVIANYEYDQTKCTLLISKIENGTDYSQSN